MKEYRMLETRKGEAEALMKVEPGARSRIFGCLYGTDWLPVLFFAAMAAAGLALAVREARRDR